MELPILYQKAKTGKITQWRIWTEDEKLFKEYGEIGGKLQITAPTICTGKNIGKSNETSSEQQAELEAKAQWQIKLEKKYSLTIGDTETDTRNLPMLAKHIDDVKKNTIKFPVYTT
ncbi:MAG: hypothetical protein ACYCVH_08610 [Ignavibacteriaceae bacterium]